MWFLIIHWSKNKRKLLNLKLIHFIPWKTFKENDLQDYHIKVSEIQEVGKFRLDPGIESRSPVLQAYSLPSEPPGKPNGGWVERKRWWTWERSQRRSEVTKSRTQITDHRRLSSHRPIVPESWDGTRNTQWVFWLLICTEIFFNV